MAIGAQVVQPQPAALVTIAMGTKGHGRIHGTRAAVRGGHRIGPDRRHWIGLPGILFTPHTGRLVRQALERFGLGRTLALGLDGRVWRVGRGCALPRPAEMQHDEEPDEDQQGKLVVKKMRNHGVAPSR